MASLIPEDFNLDQLPHSERRSLTYLLGGLDETWYLIPTVPVVVEGKDYEIDIVAVSSTGGVVLIEVKGGKLEVRSGGWYQNGQPLKRSPGAQAAGAKHALVRRLKKMRVDHSGLFMNHAVAFPDIGDVPAGGIGPDLPREVILTRTELEWPEEALNHLVRKEGPIPEDRIVRFIQALRPDLVLDEGPPAFDRIFRRRADAATDSLLSALEALDVNQEVWITGAAGTGKTGLVRRWAKRAVDRNERVLAVSYNRPLADWLKRKVGIQDNRDRLVANTFHEAILSLLRPHGYEMPSELSDEYWKTGITGALAELAEEVGKPFDTVIVDEGQDFYHEWLESLRSLLDPQGPQRFLAVADPTQDIYVENWQLPPAAMTYAVTRLELDANLRSSRTIAKFSQQLGGAGPFPHNPVGYSVEHGLAGGLREARRQIQAFLTPLLDDHRQAPRGLAVLTTRAEVRDRLLADPPDGIDLVRWENRSEDSILCETVKRAKGLEFNGVALVCLDDEPDRRLLYIGSSRACMWLRVITPRATADGLGL